MLGQMAVKDLIELYDVAFEDATDTESSTTRVSSSLGWKGKGKAMDQNLSLPLAGSSQPTTPSSVTLNGDTRRPSTSYEGNMTAETSHLLGADDSKEMEHGSDRGPSRRRTTQAGGKGRSYITTPHIPVPATTVFAYDAAPLYLPDLDDYLSRLESPIFTSYPTGVRVGKAVIGQGMFPPMDRLAANKESLANLEHNSVVAPSWRNRNSIFGGLVNLALGLTGSSVVATFYSLHGILDTVQIFALLLSTIIPHSSMSVISSEWKKLFLGTIPNVIAFNFGSTFLQSIVFMGIIMSLTTILLYLFWSATNKCEPPDIDEGLPTNSSRKSEWSLIVVSFFLSVLYLPLSTIATHALVWADDFWIVPNPYVNATTDPPQLSPLGPANEFHDPLDFCYTTTMRRNEVNYAPIIVLVSAATFGLVTVWFPLRLRNVINESVPKVDRYTELGKLRTNSDRNREYQRLLDRDRHPLTFLYSDFRLGWGAYKSFYLLAKLSALLIIAVISPDNCFFRTLSRTGVSIARQAVLVTAMLAFFLLQCFLSPFVDPVNNASEWMSRLNYLLTSLAGLGVAANMPGQDILNGPILYIIYIVTYGFSAYFTVINFSWMRRIVKRLTGRVDFSIDIFSPKINLTSSSPHVRRRIWQEVITTLFLTTPDCKIPVEQPMIYAEAHDSEYPPFLLNFKGSPAERHVENLKILREIGQRAYSKALLTVSEDTWRPLRVLQDEIEREFVGPDCYWDDAGSVKTIKRISHFGTAWWIPFPPTLVIRFDDGPLTTLVSEQQLRDYVTQNRSKEIRKKRQIRTALRAMEGQIVHWPYEYVQPVGRHVGCCCGRRYEARTIRKFQSCVLSIIRRGRLQWGDFNFGSGFTPELVYAKDVTLDGDVIGLSDDWSLSPSLARFLSLNQDLILKRLHLIEHAIRNYREYHRRQCHAKTEVLRYSFLMTIYNEPQRYEHVIKRFEAEETDLRVRSLPVTNKAAFVSAYERFEATTKTEANAWWYILWDDIWRRNYDTIKGLSLHAQDFDPHYPTSIAYRPLPRPALESFLKQRGLYSSKSKPMDFFHVGFLNKLYFRLNSIVIKDPKHAIVFHLGEGSSEFALSDIDVRFHSKSSSLGTGGGTDHDDSSIRARPIYDWEGILEDPLLTSKTKPVRQGWRAKLGVWLGITPLWRTGVVSPGLALDVKLVGGKFVLLPAS